MIIDNKPVKRRNTIQKEIVLNAVRALKKHSTADEVYDYVKKEYPSISKGTVYRDLGILAEEGSIKKVENPFGADRFDFTVGRHYHVSCVKCGEVYDADTWNVPELKDIIRDDHGFEFFSYDIVFKGLCPVCKAKNEK